MMGERSLYALTLLLALSLPLSALLRRRVAAGSAFRLGLIWFVIIAGLLLAVKLLGLDREQARPAASPSAPSAYFT